MASVGAIKAGEAFVEIGADLSRLRKGLDRAQGMLRSAGAQMRRAGMGIMAVGAAAASGLGAAAKQAGDFQSQVRDLERVTSEGVAENISKSVREMAKVMPTGTTELMRLAQTAGSLGIEGTDNIETFMEVAAQMGTATRVSAEESGQSLGKMSNAFNIPIKQAKNMGSTIAGLAKENAAWGDEIVEAMLKSASSAGQLDMKFSDLAAIQATLISSGMQASRAGTLLNTTLTRMAGDTEKVAEALDIPLEQFRALVDENPTDALRLIAQEMGNIESRSERMAVAKEMFGIRSGKVLGQFINNIQSANENLAIASNLYDEGSELQRQYNVVTKSFNSQMTILWNNVKEVGLVIGTTLLPALSRIGQYLVGVVQQIQTFVQQNREWAKTFAIVATALIGVGGALIAVGTMATVAAYAIGALGSTVGVVTTLTGAISALGKAAVGTTIALPALGGGLAAIKGALASAAAAAGWFAVGLGTIAAIAATGLGLGVVIDSVTETNLGLLEWLESLRLIDHFWSELAAGATRAMGVIKGVIAEIIPGGKNYIDVMRETEQQVAQVWKVYESNRRRAAEAAKKAASEEKQQREKIEETMRKQMQKSAQQQQKLMQSTMQQMGKMQGKLNKEIKIPEPPDISDLDIKPSEIRTDQRLAMSVSPSSVGTFSAFGQGRTSGISSRLDEQTNLAHEQLSEQRQMREALEDSKAVTR